MADLDFTVWFHLIYGYSTGLFLGIITSPITAISLDYLLEHANDDVCLEDFDDDSKPNSKSDIKPDDNHESSVSCGTIIKGVIVVGIVLSLIIIAP